MSLASKIDNTETPMNPSRRHFVHLAVASAALPAVARVARAQGYPTRPVRLIVPFPAGGTTDTFARLAAQKLSERLGKQFYVENIVGASGNIATSQAARAAPDGHTVLVAFTSFVINPSMFPRLSYDPHKDFEPVTLAVSTTNVLMVHPSVKAKSIDDLIDLIRAHPGKYAFASPGVGTPAHLVGEKLRLLRALDLTHVPFGGGAPAVAAVAAGHTPLGFTALPDAAPLIKDGKLRGVAVTSKTRSPVQPDVPTMAESGYPEIEGESWVGLLVPAGTPQDIVVLLHREIVRALPDLKERLTTIGLDPIGSTPEEFATRIKAEIQAWGQVIRAAGIPAL
jgi:tripartite-type tricarboxylate transporter receptor subunit TctC